MPIPQHRDPRQRLAAILALPITPYDKRAVGIAFAAHAHAAGIRFQDPRLEMGFDGPGVQGLFEGFEGWEFLADMEGGHFVDEEDRGG